LSRGKKGEEKKIKANNDEGERGMSFYEAMKASGDFKIGGFSTWHGHIESMVWSVGLSSKNRGVGGM